MKPSERDPSAPMLLAQLAKDAGVPDGVLNIIHGQHDAVNFICDNEHIRAISFVGGDAAGRHIYERGSKNGKRVQCNMAAKNHGTILPDCNKEASLNALVGAAFGAAGQRCMALSAAVLVCRFVFSPYFCILIQVKVGEAYNWLDDLAEKTKQLKVRER